MIILSTEIHHIVGGICTTIAVDPGTATLVVSTPSTIQVFIASDPDYAIYFNLFFDTLLLQLAALQDFTNVDVNSVTFCNPISTS